MDILSVAGSVLFSSAAKLIKKTRLLEAVSRRANL